MPIHDEAVVLGNLVIEQAASRIGLMGLPVHTFNAGCLGSLVHTFDQQASHTLATRSRVGKQVLHVAGGLNPRRAAVEQEVGEAEQLAVGLGHQCKHGFVLVEETGPGGCCDFGCQGGFAFAAIEGVVACPEGFPGLEIGGLEGADVDGGWHGGRMKECGLFSANTHVKG